MAERGKGPNEICFTFHGVNIALSLSFFEDQSETFQKSLTVFIVFEDLPSFNSSGDDMLQKARGLAAIAGAQARRAGIKSSLARHNESSKLKVGKEDGL